MRKRTQAENLLGRSEQAGPVTWGGVQPVVFTEDQSILSCVDEMWTLTRNLIKKLPVVYNRYLIMVL
jgi:hypothetical protein